MNERDNLKRAIQAVVDNDNCSGCGMCCALTPDLTMEISPEGFLRPRWSRQPSNVEISAGTKTAFDSACPGKRTQPLREAGRLRHPIFGDYVETWQGWATDESVRHAGSSGGVLTALAGWVSSRGESFEVVGAGSSREKPARTVPVRITTKAEALAAAGSRYAPVAVDSVVDPNNQPAAIVGKPCEVAALRAVSDEMLVRDRALLLSFFCAGTPSQRATSTLSASLGIDSDHVQSLAYRGEGWPGRFRVTDEDGSEKSASYEESWGSHLGRDLQWRCKICADGTGESADISVGDFWDESSDGYPSFSNAPGKSVVIVRSKRGVEALRACVKEGLIELTPIDLDVVRRIQPLQTDRRMTLLGRIVGRKLAGKKVPKYRGYGTIQHAIRRPLKNIRAMLGTLVRSRRPHSEPQSRS